MSGIYNLEIIIIAPAFIFIITILEPQIIFATEAF
jgi:hypothetical protein